MIVTCPNCDARYKLSDEVVARGARLKCAACEHRWVPEATAPAPPVVPATEADEEAAFAAVQEQISARWNEPAARPDTAATIAPTAEPIVQTHEEDIDSDEDDAGPEADAPRPTLVRNLVAGLAGVALSIAAVGLWLGRVDLAALPGAAAAFDRLAPPAALEISVRGETTPLASGQQLLEVSGIIRNIGNSDAEVPDLAARLSGPGGTALRWTIAPRIRHLPPGTETEFSSTVTGFPADARDLSVTRIRRSPF